MTITSTMYLITFLIDNISSYYNICTAKVKLRKIRIAKLSSASNHNWTRSEIKSFHVALKHKNFKVNNKKLYMRSLLVIFKI